ncbi:MAG: HDOD domain-containing protein [Burkholderiaceae bacterium]|nr:HDOD domain-containing protein [Burkholderiaceae bacterium]
MRALTTPSDAPPADGPAAAPADRPTVPDGGVDDVHPLDRLLAQMQGASDFPALSQAIQEVSCLTASDRENIGRLSGAVMQDFALSQRLLRLANSSAYRPAGQEPVSTVTRALMVLGLDTVRTIAVSLLLFENLRSVSRAVPLRDEFVRATVACSIARSVLTPGTRVCEEAGLAAMFHRLGQVMVLHHLPQPAAELQALATPNQTHLQADRHARRVLGVSYEDLGHAVAQSWGFPDVLLQGLRRLDSHSPAPRCTTYESTVRVAAGFAGELCDLIASGAAHTSVGFEQLTRRYAASLELKDGALPELLMLARKRAEQLGQAMGMEVSSTPFGRLMLALENRNPAKAADHGALLTAGGAPRPAAAGRDAAPAARPASAGAAPAPAPAPAAKALEPHEIDQRRNSLASGLAALSENLAGRFVLNDILRGALDTLHGSLQCRRVLFAMRDAQGEALNGRFGAGSVEPDRLRLFRIVLADDGDLLSAAARKGADLLISDAGAANVAGRLPAWHRQHYAAGSFLLLPVMVNGAPKGMIYADCAETGGLQIEDAALALVRAIRNQVVMALR